MENPKKDDVDISKLYGEDCILSTQDFLKKHNISEKRFNQPTS